MLDDLKKIHERDPGDALGVAEKQAEQYRHQFGFAWEPSQPIHSVVVAGMGGSALAAKAYKVSPGLQVPFEIVQDYDLPDWADANTLLICSSYSGNTEETVSVLEQALDDERPYPRPMIVVVASGGTLLALAEKHKLPFIQLPGQYQPRFTFGFQYRALAEIFNATPLQDAFLPVLEAAAGALPDHIAQYVPAKPTAQNQAKQLALEMMGKSVVVYAGPRLAPVAYKWKISCNENAKHVAWWNQFPEFNHNEFMGWTRQPEQKPYAVVELRSGLEHPRIQKRFEISDKLLSGLRPAPFVVEAAGKSLLEQTMQLIALGDFASMYLAILGNINPTPVDLIEKLKKELAK